MEQSYWDAAFHADGFRPVYDGWLNKYHRLLTGAETVVDLGCGGGEDCAALAGMGVSPIACDFSPAALERLRARLPCMETRCFDMRDGLPFGDSSVDVMLSDLSLHYFDAQTTRKVTADILRALKPGGALLCRVNARADYAPQTGDMLLEDGYFFTGGCARRYFDERDARAFLGGFLIGGVMEVRTEKYGRVKHILEIAARKPGA